MKPKKLWKLVDLTMIKLQEAFDQNSCFNKAKPEEMIFVLLARDCAMPDTIRFWCKERIIQGKNKFEDAQIQEAMACAESVDGKKISEAALMKNVQELPGLLSSQIEKVEEYAKVGENWQLEKHIQDKLNKLILSTPTSEYRNKLTEVNLLFIKTVEEK
jgi:hypothetical protein